jgi:hypothetical protein
MTEYEAERMRMLEIACERYKASAGMWRNEAYRLGGTPLPWDAEELIQKAVDAYRIAWLGLSDEEIFKLWAEAVHIDNGRNAVLDNQPFVHFARAIEAEIKRKNT